MIPRENGVRRAHLFVTVACLALCFCGGRSSESIPSKLSRFPADLGNPKLEVSGIYPDGWVIESGSVTLRQPSGTQILAVRGTVPQVGNPGFTTQVQLHLDEKEVGRKSVVPGGFQITAPVKSVPGNHRVTLAFSDLQPLPAGDGRMVGAHIEFLGFDATPLAESDILKGSGVELGSGWGPVEKFSGETFRWVDNDAKIQITVEAAQTVAVIVTAESGPGLGVGSFLLKLMDSTGRQLGALPVRKRGTVTFFVSVDPGKANEFHLHVDGGGKRVPQDPRVLNFRVFELETKPWNSAVK